MYSEGFNESTPFTVIFSLPPPSILAPIFFKHEIKSTTSGSLAAFVITVVPLASTAAIIAFSVPVTVTVEKSILPPLRPPFAFAFIYPSEISISAPNFCMQSMCKFTGLLPIAHPPGSATSAS